MRRALLLAVGLLVGLGGVTLGMGCNLDKPSIAIPTDPQTRKPDAVAEKFAAVLLSHEKAFTGGSFVNAHSRLYFAGGAKGVNALLADLANIEGATVRIKLSKDAGVTRRLFPAAGARAESPCDCEVDHNGWGDGRVVTFTVYLGGGRLDPGELELPAVSGRAHRPGK